MTTWATTDPTPKQICVVLLVYVTCMDNPLITLHITVQVKDTEPIQIYCIHNRVGYHSCCLFLAHQYHITMHYKAFSFNNKVGTKVCRVGWGKTTIFACKLFNPSSITHCIKFWVNLTCPPTILSLTPMKSAAPLFPRFHS